MDLQIYNCKTCNNYCTTNKHDWLKHIKTTKHLKNDRIKILQEILSKEPDIQKSIQVVVYKNKQWQVCNQMSYVLACLSVMYPELVYKSDMEYYEMAKNCPILSQLPKDIIYYLFYYTFRSFLGLI